MNFRPKDQPRIHRMSGFTIQDPAYIFFFLAPSLPAPFHFSSNKQGSQIARFRNQNPLKKAYPDSSSQEIPHIPIWLGFPIQLLPWPRLYPEPATSSSTRQQIKNSGKKKPIREQRTAQGLPSQGTRCGNGDKRAGNQQPRRYVTQRVRSGKGSPPKDRRRRDGGAQGVASLGKRHLQLQ